MWDTLRRDLLAVWSKMREVLWPRYLLGGTMFESAEGLRGVYANLRGAGIQGGREELAGLAGRVLDPEALLNQNTMTPGLRDWDLWGPLIFCLLLSMLLSFNAKPEQRDEVFSGVFAMVWIGEAVVTLQIKLLGGNMWVIPRAGSPRVLSVARVDFWLTFPVVTQFFCPERLHHRLHPLPARHRRPPLCAACAADPPDSRLPRPGRLVPGSWYQYPRRQRRGKEQGRAGYLPVVCLLSCSGLPLLYQLG